MTGRFPLLLAACAILALLAVACGGSKVKTIDNATGSGTTAPNDAKTTPDAKMPVSRFAVSLDDLGTDFITNVDQTWDLTAKSYGAAGGFDTAANGEKMLNQWNYVGGYETSYRPENAPQSVIANGAYYATVEVHLFKDQDGAKKFYDYVADRVKKSISKEEKTPQLGNESIGYSLTAGNVAGSETVQATEELFMFRRGNVIGIVNTYGAAGFMNITKARAIAVIEDNKILGKHRAPVPTPISNFTPNTGASSTAVVSPTAAATAAG